MSPFEPLQSLLDESVLVESRKLQPAMFLVQQVKSELRYRFGLVAGRVFSDDLDLELAHLDAFGMLAPACSLKSHSAALIFVKSTTCDQEHSELSSLQRALFELMHEDAETLEAAATNIFFARENLGQPAEKLRWYRELSPQQRDRAETLFR
jgi:hypothetical protein